MPETDLTPSEAIERLEAEIDELRDAIRRSRRLAVVGRVCAIAGIALLAALLFGLALLTPLRMIVGLSLGLGGLVLMGSSVGSTRQFERTLKRAEAERSAAIDDLQLVPLDGEAR